MKNMKFKNAKKLLLSGAFVFGLCLTSCETEEINNEEVDAIENEDKIFVTKYLSGNPVKVQDLGKGVYSLGGSDIHLFEGQLSDSFNPISPGSGETALAQHEGITKWPDNTVIYYLSSSLSSTTKSEWRKAMNEWEDKTNVRFKERDGEREYVRVSYDYDISGNGGYATAGIFRGAYIKIGRNTKKNVITHEIGHTLGFMHEQNRSDRRNTIEILWNNIDDEEQFEMDYGPLLTDKLDITSVMMYGSYASTRNGRATIKLKERVNGSSYFEQEWDELSSGDIEGANKAYPKAGTQPNDDEYNSGPCAGMQEWDPNKDDDDYNVGEYVHYNGHYWKMRPLGWNYRGRCN